MQKKIIDSFFQKLKINSFAVQYWDGEEKKYCNEDPKVKIIIKKPFPLTFDLTEPMLSFAEAYMDDIIDFEGDFDEVMKIAEQADLLVDLRKGNFINRAANLVNKKSRQTMQKENICQHYGLGNDFFSLWLDETMSYSCGYFKNSTDSLYEAQINKIDHILSKLQLKKKEKLLDIGSGWGWLIIRAAQCYGVRATGITISEDQYTESVKRIESLGLQGRVEVKLLDYLDMDEEEYSFDKIASVGMFEHVGKDNLDKYMEKVNKLLRPGGLSMLHSIMTNNEGDVNAWIEKYIFPGGYVPSLRETVSLLPKFNFYLLHAESLRLHYAKTLDNWHNNYIVQRDKVEDKFGRRFARMWDLYLKACSSKFRVSDLNVYQLLFSKGRNNDLPVTFEYIYK